MLLVVFSCLLYVAQSCSNNGKAINSFLWKIESNHSVVPSFLFGTVHVAYTAVWDRLPDNVKEAFKNADSTVFELDLTDVQTVKSLAKCQFLSGRNTLSSILPANIYGRIKKQLEYVRRRLSSWITEEQRRKGLFADYLYQLFTRKWRRKRPIWVILMLNSLTKNNIAVKGESVLDLYLTSTAHSLNKKVGAIERVFEHCLPLNQLDFSQVLVYSYIS